MASPFARASAAAERVVVRTFGRRFRLTPLAPPTDGQARYVVGGADPARDPREIEGVFSDVALPAQVTGSGANSRANAEVMAARYRIHFSASSFATEPPPQRGDKLQAMDSVPGAAPRVVGPVYRIVAVEPCAAGDKVECLLVEV